jgi:hypothetical protein
VAFVAPRLLGFVRVTLVRPGISLGLIPAEVGPSMLAQTVTPVSRRLILSAA